VSGDGLPRDKVRRERERVCVALLPGGELDGGRRATMWVSPHSYLCVDFLSHNFPTKTLYIFCSYRSEKKEIKGFYLWKNR
jgi:hypothetical protein